MKVYHILLVFLEVTLAFSIAKALPDITAQQIVKGICKQTTDTKFCSEVLAKNLATSSPSKKDLMNVTVKEGERFSGNTHFFISTLLRNAGEEKSSLQMCAAGYAIANFAFMNVESSLEESKNGNIGKLHEKVVTGVGICKTDFNVRGYKINPLIERNRKTLTFVDMAKIVDRLH